MSREDWYRNRKWNDSISKAFFTKLNRARAQKMQYLVIQSGYLLHKHPSVSLKLIKQYFEQRHDKFFDNNAFENQAKALLQLEDIENAIISYRNVLEREEAFPNSKTNSSVEYPYFVATNNIKSEYQNVLSVLNNKDESILIWPVNKFQWYAALAIINNDDYSAKQAIDIAKTNKSSFRYHQKLGLVGREHNKTIKKLINLVKLKSK